MLNRIPLKAVQEKYNSIAQIWSKEDYWHFHLYKSYSRILRSLEKTFPDGLMLNFGSARENYHLDKTPMVYLDAAERSLPANEFAVCGDAHYMPFGANSFQSVIAIGSVINYCAPAEVFLEVSRILEAGGIFVFDFEQSEAFEHHGSALFGKDAHIFETDFNEVDEVIWVFKFDHIKNLLEASGLVVNRVINIHAISSLVWRITESNNLTAAACKIDRLSCFVPFFRNYSSNVLIIAQKIT